MRAGRMHGDLHRGSMSLRLCSLSVSLLQCARSRRPRPRRLPRRPRRLPRARRRDSKSDRLKSATGERLLLRLRDIFYRRAASAPCFSSSPRAHRFLYYKYLSPSLLTHARMDPSRELLFPPRGSTGGPRPSAAARFLPFFFSLPFARRSILRASRSTSHPCLRVQSLSSFYEPLCRLRSRDIRLRPAAASWQRWLLSLRRAGVAG